MANRRFTQFFNTLHTKPVLLDCSFTVDPTNAAGVSGLVGPGIEAVYMNANTPSSSNPDPAAGYVVVKLQDNYHKLYSAIASVRSPNSGSNLLVASAGLTVGQVYVITVLGTTTTAQWIALGVPRGITPAVGVPFVALATSATGTGAVQIPAAAGSGIVGFETVGDSDLVINSALPNIAGQQSGSYIIGRFLGASFTGSALAAHTHNLLVKGGQAASTTNNIAHYPTDILGKEAATDATILGADSATKGGVITASAGTPAGTIAMATAAPATGSVISLAIYLSNSRITVQGE